MVKNKKYLCASLGLALIMSACSNPVLNKNNVLTDEQAWLSLANAYYESGNTEKAIDTLKEAISRMDSDMINERLREMMSSNVNGDVTRSDTTHNETTESPAIDYVDEAVIRVEDVGDGEEWESAYDEVESDELINEVNGNSSNNMKDYLSGKWVFSTTLSYTLDIKGYTASDFGGEINIDVNNNYISISREYKSNIFDNQFDTTVEHGTVKCSDNGFTTVTDLGNTYVFYYRSDDDTIVLDMGEIREIYNRWTEDFDNPFANRNEMYIDDDGVLRWDDEKYIKSYQLYIYIDGGYDSIYIYCNNNYYDTSEIKMKMEKEHMPAGTYIIDLFGNYDGSDNYNIVLGQNQFDYAPDYSDLKPYLQGQWHIARYGRLTPQEFYDENKKYYTEEFVIDMLYETIYVDVDNDTIDIDSFMGQSQNRIEYFYAEGGNKYEGGFEIIFEGGSKRFYYDYNTDTIIGETGTEVFERGGY